MVKLSPENQNAGWQGGYDPSIDNVAGFSHIHEWTMAGLLMMPTTGPLLLGALQAQDMYLAGTFLLMLSVLTVIGTLVSDILLAVLDPRIRMQ